MTKEQHVKILRAYVARLTLKDMEAIAACTREAWQAQQNYGMNAQIAAQNKRDAAIAAAVYRYIDYDIELIERVINRELGVGE